VISFEEFFGSLGKYIDKTKRKNILICSCRPIIFRMGRYVLFFSFFEIELERKEKQIQVSVYVPV
jgi:hypothetical protein